MPDPTLLEPSIAALIGWLLTQLLATRIRPEWRKRLPALSVILATLLVIGWNAALVAVAGRELSWEVVLTGLSAGGLAVVGHAGQSITMGANTQAEATP